MVSLDFAQGLKAVPREDMPPPPPQVSGLTSAWSQAEPQEGAQK